MYSFEVLEKWDQVVCSHSVYYSIYFVLPLSMRLTRQHKCLTCLQKPSIYNQHLKKVRRTKGTASCSTTRMKKKNAMSFVVVWFGSTPPLPCWLERQAYLLHREKKNSGISKGESHWWVRCQDWGGGGIRVNWLQQEIVVLFSYIPSTYHCFCQKFSSIQGSDKFAFTSKNVINSFLG